jgi:phosphoadenosine phosphosulfate reductase
MSQDLALQLERETSGVAAEPLLAHMVRRFGDRVALASSLGAEDQVVTDMLSRIAAAPNIFTLDTGRLPPETYDTIDATNKRYGLKIRVAFPDREQVEAMTLEHGPNLFYASIENRKRCCQVRKIVPLRRELDRLDAWITGLRREQSQTRVEVRRIEWDSANGLIKVNPLADWTTDEVWNYIREHNVPYNALHDRGYPSIGCAPCTRAVGPGEGIRAGRWWWELPEQKECGLHLKDGRFVPIRGEK